MNSKAISDISESFSIGSLSPNKLKLTLKLT